MRIGLLAHVRAMYEKDIRLFSADGKRWVERLGREKKSRDAVANLPRHLFLSNPFHVWYRNYNSGSFRPLQRTASYKAEDTLCRPQP